MTPHDHGPAMEICYLVRGQQTYEVGGRFYTLKGGDVFVTFPGEVHSTGGLPEEKGTLYWLILPVDSPQSPSLLGLAPAESAALRRALRELPRRLFAGRGNLAAQLNTAAELCMQPDFPLKSIAVGHCLLGFLLAVIESARPGTGRALPRSRETASRRS